jgi:hypothetical protein
MNPYPFWELNHFTVPRAIVSLQELREACIAHGSREIHERPSRTADDRLKLIFATSFEAEKINTITGYLQLLCAFTLGMGLMMTVLETARILGLGLP